jgi:hypothetical protein
MPVFEIHRERIMTVLRSMTAMVADPAARQVRKSGVDRGLLAGRPQAA